jgi:hypothetical protein
MFNNNWLQWVGELAQMESGEHWISWWNWDWPTKRWMDD